MNRLALGFAFGLSVTLACAADRHTTVGTQTDLVLRGENTFSGDVWQHINDLENRVTNLEND